jgi:hypothetical protein
MALSKARDPISLSSLNAGGFFASESKRVETAKEVQTQLVDMFDQFNREQLVRARQEIELASEFAARVTSARSVPDFMNAYQDWISKRLALFGEDSHRVVNTTMKLLSIGKRGRE